MRITPKAAASNTETTANPVASSKSGPVSFLDILMNGVGVGVQAADASGAQKQSSSQANPSDPSTTEEETSATGSSEAAMGASTSTESWLTKDENALTALVFGATASTQPATPLGKTSDTTQSAHGKSSATSSNPPANGTQAAPIVTVPIPAPVEPLPTLIAATSSLRELGNKLAAADATDTQSAQAVNRANAQQPGQTSSQTATAATAQDVLHAAPVLPNPFLDAAQNTLQTRTQDSAAGNNDTQQGSAPATAQISNQGFAVPATANAASTFLTAAISPSAMTASQFTSKLSQYKTAEVTFAAKAGTQIGSANAATTTGVTGTAKNNSQDASSSTAKNNSQAGSDSTAHTQVDASQVAGAKGTDSGVQMATAFGAMVAAHNATPDHAASSGTADAATHASAESAHLPADAAANAAGPLAWAAINSARVIQSMSETEMRVGMHSSEFGDISIRTMVSQQQVQAQISVDHSELSNAISAHIPTMQAKFGSDLGLHATIEVNQSGMNFSGERGQSSPRDQRSFATTVPVDNTPAPIEMGRAAMRITPSSIDGSRLDIRA